MHYAIGLVVVVPVAELEPAVAFAEALTVAASGALFRRCGILTMGAVAALGAPIHRLEGCTRRGLHVPLGLVFDREILIESGGAMQKHPGAREPRVGPSHNHNLLHFLLLDARHNALEIVSSQEVISKYIPVLAH
jgi:hypothetical protein